MKGDYSLFFNFIAMLYNRLKLVYIVCFFSISNYASSQLLNGTLTVFTDFPDNPDSLTIEVFSEAAKEPLFSKAILPKSQSVFKISNPEPVWLMVYIKQKGKPKAGAGRLYMKGNEIVKVYMKAFFQKAEIVGGENSFIEANRYLLFDVPTSISKSKDFSQVNLRKGASFIPRDGNLYIRLEEYKNNVLESIKKFNDYDYTLTSLWEKKNNFPLDFLDSCKTFFSKRVRGTKQWQKLDQYIKSELTILNSQINDSLAVADPKGEHFKLRELCGTREFTFIDFWASWCMPCIQEFPELKNLFASANQDSIAFLSISIDKEKADWEASNVKQEFPWESYLDFTEEIKNQLDISYIPQGVIMDKQGKIVQRFVTKEQLIDFLKEKKLIKPLVN